MRIIEITGGAVVAAVALGVYLRWALGPLAVAYRVGQVTERAAQRIRGSRAAQ
jgi:hypothetical protein